ncbi:hypothetical protein ACA910_004071 [Epithemia clementina (nom. ined.)]
MIVAPSAAAADHQRAASSYSRLFSTQQQPSRQAAEDVVGSFQLAHRLDGLEKPTVWHEFTPLSVEHGSINLGQGFPDWDPPAFVQQAITKSISERRANQYARSYAHLPLAKVLVEDYGKRWNVEMDPNTQVATTVGCTQALYCALHGIINPGDEVVMLEPAFDIYHSQVKMAGGTCVFVPLRPTDTTTGDGDMNASSVFQLDMAEFEAAITDRTKVILLNTPHNPTGKMFSRQELESIAAIVQKHPNIVVISDEVYEHIIFEPQREPHISMATLPGMFERTLTLSSSGKTFSCTGWKVGWAIGPKHLVHAVTATNQWIVFSAPTPTQDAIAQALIQAREPYEGHFNYYDYIAHEYLRKRGILQEALMAAGMTPVLPSGSFFIMADSSHLSIPDAYLAQETAAMPTKPMPRDWACCRWMTETIGVTAIPPSAFYSAPNVPLASNLMRFAFCKTDDTLYKAKAQLEKHFGA